MPCDSRVETQAHIDRVQHYLFHCIHNLANRGIRHDQSKLVEPEKLFFDKYSPMLFKLTYGSPEYNANLKALTPALDAHYEHPNNTHHPEHYIYKECGACYTRLPRDWEMKCPECGYDVWTQGGIRDMSLFSLLEMVVDWKAASERHADGDIFSSLEINRSRFGISSQLTNIIKNTFTELGFTQY